jgi:hypothetical protein
MFANRPDSPTQRASGRCPGSGWPAHRMPRPRQTRARASRRRSLGSVADALYLRLKTVADHRERSCWYRYLTLRVVPILDAGCVRDRLVLLNDAGSHTISSDDLQSSLMNA